jgi:hypothetical protein
MPTHLLGIYELHCLQSTINNDPKLFNICFKTFARELVQWKKTKGKGKQGGRRITRITRITR